MSDSDRWFSTAEAVAFLNRQYPGLRITRRTLYELVRARELPSVNVGTGDKPQLRFLRSALLGWVDARTSAPTLFAEPTAPAVLVAVNGSGQVAQSAQTLVGEWIDACPVRPPGRVIGHVAKLIAEMLDEGMPYEQLRRGFAAWHRKGLHPSALPSAVHEALNKPAGYGAASRKAAGWVELGKEMDERRGAWAAAGADSGVRRPVLEPGFGDAWGLEQGPT